MSNEQQQQGSILSRPGSNPNAPSIFTPQNGAPHAPLVQQPLPEKK
jgi:hypothetical protein